MKVFVNVITTLRFLYSLFLPILKFNVSDTAFFINILVLFLTDWVDGFLARKFKVQTLYGCLMDTVADKILTIILILLLIKHPVNMLSMVLIGEIIISCINVLGTIQGKKVSSSLQGKIKMWLLSVTILLAYLNSFDIISANVVTISSIITFIMQIFVNIGYIQNLRNQKSVKKEQKIKIKNLKDLEYVLFSTQFYTNTI